MYKCKCLLWPSDEKLLLMAFAQAPFISFCLLDSLFFTPTLIHLHTHTRIHPHIHNHTQDDTCVVNWRWKQQELSVCIQRIGIGILKHSALTFFPLFFTTKFNQAEMGMVSTIYAFHFGLFFLLHFHAQFKQIVSVTLQIGVWLGKKIEFNRHWNTRKNTIDW